MKLFSNREAIKEYTTIRSVISYIAQTYCSGSMSHVIWIAEPFISSVPYIKEITKPRFVIPKLISTFELPN